ncbi:hypothetical protein B0F90DRAFT_1927675 [Multifurca ochricompacta]|uniref:Uncharacterized protein n=1 Tax=Multifurca ochricompacta TaxID=376703 RepID=A0AAD4QJL0_9AGAM|nr:hypothetical protein B0F90DRAFT_1927675 [Multifurca ochricompacta]
MTKKNTNPWSTGKATLLATTPDFSPEIRFTLARIKNLTRPSAQNIYQTCRTPRMSTPKTLATNTSTDNETRIRRISAAPTPPPTPALPNEDPIVTRSRNALADTYTLHSPMTTQESSIDLTLQFCRPRGHVSRRQIVIGTPTLGRHSFETTSTRCTTSTDASGVMKVASCMPGPRHDGRGPATPFLSRSTLETTLEPRDAPILQFRASNSDSSTRRCFTPNWINTALDDLRDPGVWAEATRFTPHPEPRAVLQEDLTTHDVPQAGGLDDTQQPLDDRARGNHEPCRHRHSTTFGGKRQPTEGVM